MEPAAAGGIALRKKPMLPSRGFLGKQLLSQREQRWDKNVSRLESPVRGRHKPGNCFLSRLTALRLC